MYWEAAQVGGLFSLTGLAQRCRLWLVSDLMRNNAVLERHRFFHPPRCPGAAPVERGAGPNSGPDCWESLGWMILLRWPNGFSGNAR